MGMGVCIAILHFLFTLKIFSWECNLSELWGDPKCERGKGPRGHDHWKRKTIIQWSNQWLWREKKMRYLPNTLHDEQNWTWENMKTEVMGEPDHLEGAICALHNDPCSQISSWVGFPETQGFLMSIFIWIGWRKTTVFREHQANSQILLCVSDTWPTDWKPINEECPGYFPPWPYVMPYLTWQWPIYP